MLDNIVPEPDKLESSGVVPKDAAEMKADDDPEARPFRISLAKYNSKACQIDELGGDNAKAALSTLRDVGLYFTSEMEFSSRSSLDSEIKYVENAGDYSLMYKGLGGEDVDVKEIKIQRQKKGVDFRIFFYSLEFERTFFLIAIRQNHLDTTKGGHHNKQFTPRRGHWGRGR